MELISRFFHNPNQSFFLFGARGTGKTTFLKQRFGHAVYIDLLDPETYRLFSARPERLQEIIEANPGKRTIVIDEIQKNPSLLDMVHRLCESRKDLQFILTGSSSRKLKRTGADLLAGRLLLRNMHPFIAAELGKKFGLEKALRYGLLPLVLAADNPQETLQAYITLYLREEVQMEGLVRNIGNFARFLEVMSFSHAAPLNTTHVARESQIERKTVEGYIVILEDLLLAFRVPVFAKHAKRHLTQHPKFYYFDAGVFYSLRPKGPLDTPQDITGAALEGLVAQHLRAWISYGKNEHTLSFWRTKSGVEVDFIVYGQDAFWAIEVKSTRTVHPKDLNGLAAFREDYPQAMPIFLYRGRERLKVKGILCLPCEDFLENLIPGRDIMTILR